MTWGLPIMPDLNLALSRCPLSIPWLVISCSSEMDMSPIIMMDIDPSNSPYSLCALNTVTSYSLTNVPVKSSTSDST